MNTVYILGKKGFRYALSKQLGKTLKTCLPGEMLDVDDLRECQLYWVPYQVTLHDFKRKVGAFHVLKYRLKFFPSADEFYGYIQQASIADEESLKEDAKLMKDILKKYKHH